MTSRARTFWVLPLYQRFQKFWSKFKWKGPFWFLLTGQPIEMVVFFLSPFTEFPIEGKEPVCQKWKANFGRKIPTEICGPLPEVIPKKPKPHFPFDSHRKIFGIIEAWVGVVASNQNASLVDVQHCLA